MSVLRTMSAAMLALALSACGGGGSDDAVPGKAAEVPVRLAFHDCSEQTALLLVPALLMPPLPPGFVYTTPAGDGLLAAIHISGATCTPVDGGGAEQQMLAFALVKPPAALVSPEIATYAVALGGYTNSPVTHDTFEAWGLTGLLELGAVEVKLGELPLLRIGKVKAQSDSSSVTTQMTAIGVATNVGGGRTRAFFAPDGVLIASLDAIYTPQQGIYAVGTVIQRGPGPLPVGLYPAVGSHAFGYDLTVGDVLYY